MTDACFACGQAYVDDVVCETCRGDGFRMEEARKAAAQRGATQSLERLYSARYAFLKEGNVTGVWNDLLAQEIDSTLPFTRWRNRVSAGFVPADASSVLEIGVGAGHALEILQRTRPAATLYGIDIAEHSVREARRRFPSGHFEVAAVEELPWRSTFDAVVMLEVLEHIEAPRTFRVLRALRSAVRPGGRLIISVPLESVLDLRRASFRCPTCGEYVRPNNHVRSYSELEPVRSELVIAGFRVLRVFGLAGGAYFGIPRQWLMRLAPRRIRPMVAIFCCEPDDAPAPDTATG